MVEPDAPAASDDLLARAQAGDLGAFEQLVALHERGVLRLAYRVLGNREEARDVAQEALLRLFRHLRKLDREANLKAWLYRVTINLCRDAMRCRSGTAELSADEPSPEIDPETAASSEQRKQALAAALNRLPEKERAAIVLREIEGLSTREVAATLGSTEGTVRSQIFSARMKLRELVREFLGRHA